MKRINVEFKGQNHTFRTNDNGDYLFTGISQNNQISCDDGFNSLRRIKKAIREHLKYHYGYDLSNAKMPHIKYDLIASDWKN